MTGFETVALCLAAAWVTREALARPVKKLVGGVMTKGKRGKFTLSLTPIRKGKKR